MLLLVISFLAGILTVLAPCVLPLLPIIVGGSVSSTARDKARPYVIAITLAGSIIAFTLLLKVSTVLINLPPDILNYISGSLLIALGLVAILPEVWESLMVALNWQAASQRFLGESGKNKGKYIGAALTGIALGPIFASCSPTYAFILASVLPHSFIGGLIYLMTYSIGLVVALLLISLAGRRFITRFTWAVDTHSIFRRIIGVIFVAIGIVIIVGLEVPIETWVANHLPFDETKIEQVLLQKQTTAPITQSTSSSSILNVIPTAAPEFQQLTDWINSPALTMAQLKGKVVLVDFWTYSCINCLRTLPYVEKWYQTYQAKGFVVIGVNTPEFAFEHNPTNVQAAVKQDGIKYPVALDNNYGTWNAYNNNSWPADYLIDKAGNIRYVSLGEGDYDKTEKAIQELLNVHMPLQTPSSNVPITQSQTPETYFGTNRSQGYVGTPDLQNGTSLFVPNTALDTNTWTLKGNWQIGSEYITSQEDTATLHFHVSAKDVYVVASGPSNQSKPTLVGLPTADQQQYGSDVTDGKVLINGSKLYHIVSLKSPGETTVTLTVPKGVSLYTFTFGS